MYYYGKQGSEKHIGGSYSAGRIVHISAGCAGAMYACGIAAKFRRGKTASVRFALTERRSLCSVRIYRGIALDPIEKEAIFHAYPGSKA